MNLHFRDEKPLQSGSSLWHNEAGRASCLHCVAITRLLSAGIARAGPHRARRVDGCGGESNFDDFEGWEFTATEF